MEQHLNISEIFASIQGESRWAGLPCTFVRLSGCPLNCSWCDSRYASENPRRMALTAILAEVERLAQPAVEVTGGEPLAQPATLRLLNALTELGSPVLLETSGAETLTGVPPAVHIVMDVKCPSSGMAERHHPGNFALLKPTDDIKFVLADRVDFDFAMRTIEQHDLTARTAVFLSCVHGRLDPRELAAWMVEAKRPCRLQLQLHKYIWEPERRGV
jgi:7-carboxy-7-deazaguanine synthase